MTSAPYTINGRFLSQKVTGVQRYALNVVTAIDGLIGSAGPKVSLLAPRKSDDPGLSNLSMLTRGSLSGQLWEQTTLPLHCQGRLLNLCNTGPISKSDQIICIHDANIFVSPESYSYKFRVYYQRIQPLLVRRAARVVTVSHAAARQIARHLPVAVEDIAVIPNGHEHALKWDPHKAVIAPALFENEGFWNDRPFVVAFGSRASHKNIGMILSAAAELQERGINIIIAGGGARIFSDNAQQSQPDEQPSQPNVRYLGHVTDHDLAFLIDRALCLVFPSLTEGFGLPLVEAMARGCPVISSDSASMPEICGNAALFASPFDRAAWIRSICSLKQSSELRRELIGRGLEQVKNFSWSRAAAEYLNLLENPKADVKAFAAPRRALPTTTVIVASRGRPAIVTATVRWLLEHQTLKPQAVIISCPDLADAGALGDDPRVTVILGPAGLAAQRNTALQHVAGATDFITFFDDDFIADKDWLAVAATTFRDESQVVGFTGRVVADGVNGPGLSFDEGVNAIINAPPVNWRWIENYSPYGCNMAFRTKAIGQSQFDERLVLYGWLEDRDFAAMLKKKGGRFVKVAAAVGVHMGAKSGRVSGERFGYSQIINPLYMLGKGTMSLSKVITHVGGNTASNFGRALRPEPFVDRRGRAKGNLIAVGDLLRGRLQPERAQMISAPARRPPYNTELKP